MATAPGRRADAEIHRDVLDEWHRDARMRPHQVVAVVADGVVRLTGRVDSYARKWAAERSAHRVRGVRAVANDIEVRLPGRRSGQDVAWQIRQALARRLGGDRIRVTVRGRDVVLTGSVRSWRERNEAERVACSAPGVWSVDDRLVVTAE